MVCMTRNYTNSYWTYDKDRDLVIVNKVAAKKLKEMHSGPPNLPANVYQMQRQTRQRRTSPRGHQQLDCYCSGGKHMASEWRFNNEPSYFGERLGHIARVFQAQKKTATEAAAGEGSENTSLDKGHE